MWSMSVAQENKTCYTFFFVLVAAIFIMRFLSLCILLGPLGDSFG